MLPRGNFIIFGNMKTLLAFILFLFLSSAGLAEVDYIKVDPDNLGMTPEEYVGVPIKLKCRFIRLDYTWLNDREVYRSADKYVGLAVKASDRIFANIFAPKKMEAYLKRFEKNDRLIIYGLVFSAKHQFPWIDVDRVSEGWVVGEEPEEVRQRRVKMAKDYAEFLETQSQLLKNFDLDSFADLIDKQDTLIQLLIDKKIFSRKEFDRALARRKSRPTPPPLWEKILREEE